MNLLNMIGFGGNQNHTPTNELPDTFPFPIKEGVFIENDIRTIYIRILTDTLRRTQGLKEDYEGLLWDNCVYSQEGKGLVSLIADAMAKQNELFLVYKKELDLIRVADQGEKAKIQADYKKMNKSETGIYLTFKDFTQTDMMKVYSALEFCTIRSLFKSMNLSSAIQFKMSDLRKSVNTIDAKAVIDQAAAIAKGMKDGKDALMDSNDIVETATPAVEATKNAIDFIAQKRSFYLGLPASYITGLAPKGLGDTGEGDAKAVERGLLAYYYVIIKPVLEDLLDAKTTFKTEDFYAISTALSALKDFSITDNEYISAENKLKIINRLFNLPEDSEGDEVEEPKKTDPVPPTTNEVEA